MLTIAVVATVESAEMRTWTAAKGGYSAEAELVELTDDGTVVLKSKTGKVVRVPLDRLSSADQQYVRRLTAAVSGKSSAASPAKTPEEVEAEALACRTAKDAVLVYKFYLAKPNLTAAQRTAAQAQA